MNWIVWAVGKSRFKILTAVFQVSVRKKLAYKSILWSIRYITASFRVWSNCYAENSRITCNIVDETIIGVLFARWLFRVHFFSRMDFKMWYI